MTRTVAFVGQKGGVGKTTAAALLALYHADQGRQVHFVDADQSLLGSKWVEYRGVETSEVTDADEMMEAEFPEGADLVVIDCGGGLAAVNRAACLRADLCVIPLGPSILEIKGAAATARLIRQAQSIRNGSPAALLTVTRLRHGTRVGKAVVEAAEQIGVPLAQTTLGMRTAFVESASLMCAPWDIDASSFASTEAKSLCQEITDVLHPVG